MIEELNGDFIQWLRGFYFIAKTGSIRRASVLMNRSASTLSYQLKSLESDLNTVLFDRYKKGMNLTPEGKKLLDWTISTFETLKCLRSEVGNLQGQLKGEITIACNLPIARKIVDCVAAFRMEHPEVNILIRRAMPYEVVDDVESSRVDFGFTGLTALPELCEFEELFLSRPLLVVRRDNDYGLPEKPGLKDLERLPFVSFLSEQMDDKGDPYFGSNAVTEPYIKKNAICVNSNFLMLQYVLRGVGVAIMDEMSITSSSFNIKPSPFKLYSLEAFLPVVHYGLLIRRHKHLTPQAAALIRILREDCGPDSADNPADLPVQK